MMLRYPHVAVLLFFVNITYPLNVHCSSKGLPTYVGFEPHCGKSHEVSDIAKRNSQKLELSSALVGIKLFVANSGEPQAKHSLLLFDENGELVVEQVFSVAEKAQEVLIDFSPVNYQPAGKIVVIGVVSHGDTLAKLQLCSSRSIATSQSEHGEATAILEDAIAFMPIYDMAEHYWWRAYNRCGGALSIGIAAILFVYLAREHVELAAACTFFILGTLFALIRWVGYLDEFGHFAFAYHLAYQWSLPLVDVPQPMDGLLRLWQEVGFFLGNPGPHPLNYEAVQPPLYYSASALLIRLSDYLSGAIWPAFYLMRILNVILISASLVCSSKTYRRYFAVSKSYTDMRLFQMCCLLFVIAPSFLFTQTLASNDGMLIFWGTLLVCKLISVLDDSNESVSSGITLGVIGSCVVLAKINGIYLPGLTVIALLLARRLPTAAVATVTFLLGVTPWFYFNYRHYGAITGMAAHLEFATAVINPLHTKIPLSYFWKGAPIDFFLNFFSCFGACLGTSFFKVPLGVASIALTSGFLHLVSTCLRQAAQLSLVMHRAFRRKQALISAILVGTIGAPFLMMCLLTAKANIIYVIPRYAYGSLFPSVMLVERGFNILPSMRARYMLVCAVLSAELLYLINIASIT
jgi:hypothetical protein